MAVSGCAVMTDACHQGCFTPANHYFLSLPPPPAERRRRRVNILIAPKHAIALRSTRRLVNGPALGSAPRSRREPPLRAPVSQWAPATHPSCAARYNEHSSRRADVSVGRPMRPLSSNYFHHRGRIQLMGGLGPNWITGLLSYAME